MTDIGTLVEELIAAGTPPAAAARIVAQAYVAGAATVERRSAGAIRQQRYRDRKVGHNDASRSVTNNAGIMHDDDTTKDAERNAVTGNGDVVSLSPVPLLSPHTPLITPLPPNPSQKLSARGHRLPEDWVFSGPDLAFALSKGFTAEHAAEIFEKFTNFWWSASGKNAVKKNWHQAWRVWLLNEKPSARASPAKPITAFQQRRNETQDILNGLDNFARNGSLSSEKDTRLLGYDPGERPTAVRDGPCEDADDLSFAGDRARN